jgi:hypothetical protein
MVWRKLYHFQELSFLFFLIFSPGIVWCVNRDRRTHLINLSPKFGPRFGITPEESRTFFSKRLRFFLSNACQVLAFFDSGCRVHMWHLLDSKNHEQKPPEPRLKNFKNDSEADALGMRF